MTNYLVTGSAGFIGSHVAARLLDGGHQVIGFDNLNSYYDVRLKEARLATLQGRGGFTFVRGDLEDAGAVTRLFSEFGVERVIHLAAQAGVRYSLENPRAYIDSNIVGFLNILEACRHRAVKHLIYASSSSVYGANTELPFRTGDRVDHPISLYAATKKANELMAHTYSHLFNLPTTGLRFFTVYGPWGRPDMSLFLFTKAILAGDPIKIFNHGAMRRDFTFIDDIVEGVVRVADSIPTAANVPHVQNVSSRAPYRIYNIGNNQPVELLDMIAALERELGVTAKRELLPMQPGDVPATYADVDDLVADVGFQPATPIAVGIKRFVEWYRAFYPV